MVVEQLSGGSDNFCYLIVSSTDKKAALVDPSLDATTALTYIKDHALTLEYIILTHYHSDHTAALPNVKRHHPLAKIVASQLDSKFITPKVNQIVKNGSKLTVGAIPLTIIHTPGHTPGGICILVDDEALITGDTLFIGDCGRTDLTGGSMKTMYETLQNKILPLPNHLIVYPGHDYGDQPSDTLGHQKKTNKTLKAKTLQDFAWIP